MTILDECMSISIIQSDRPFVIEPLYHKVSKFGLITVTYIQVQLSCGFL